MSGNASLGLQNLCSVLGATLDSDYFKVESGKIVPLVDFLAQQSHIAGVDTDLEDAYEAGDLDIEAEIIAALNATNARVNELATTLNSVLAALEAVGLLATEE